MFQTFHILYPKVFLIGVKDFVEALICLSFSHFTAFNIPLAFHPSTPLSPRDAGFSSVFVCVFIVLLFYQVFCNCGKELLLKVWLSPGATL